MDTSLIPEDMNPYSWAVGVLRDPGSHTPEEQNTAYMVVSAQANGTLVGGGKADDVQKESASQFLRLITQDQSPQKAAGVTGPPAPVAESAVGTAAATPVTSQPTASAAGVPQPTATPNASPTAQPAIQPMPVAAPQASQFPTPTRNANDPSAYQEDLASQDNTTNQVWGKLAAAAKARDGGNVTMTTAGPGAPGSSGGGSTSYTLPGGGGYGNYSQGDPEHSTQNGYGPTSDVLTDPRMLEGSYSGVGSAYLQKTQMDDPYLMEKTLQGQGIDPNGYTSYLMKDNPASVEGLWKLSNPGSFGTADKFDTFGAADNFYKSMATGKGGAGMPDVHALYDNMFAGGQGIGSGNGYLGSDPTPQGQIGSVQNLVASLYPYLPETTAQSIDAQLNMMVFDYQDMANTGQIDPASYSFIDYMRDNGAENWL